jgi:hypothetical protein
VFAACLFVLAAPSAAHAQSAIAGVVKDTSGAVMPGVTVEASSEALIEKVRTAVTDGNGLYNIIDLRPGTYLVTFTQRIQTFKREGLNWAASPQTHDESGRARRIRQGLWRIAGDRRPEQCQVGSPRAKSSIRCRTLHDSLGALIPAFSPTAPDAASAQMQQTCSVHGFGPPTTDDGRYGDQLAAE